VYLTGVKPWYYTWTISNRNLYAGILLINLALIKHSSSLHPNTVKQIILLSLLRLLNYQKGLKNKYSLVFNDKRSNQMIIQSKECTQL